MSFAKIVVSGTVLTPPEKRYTPNGAAVVTFDVSVSTPPRGSFAPDAPFPLKVTCWNRLADAAAESLAPQQTVLLEGKLMMGATQAPDGVSKKHFEMEASSLSVITGAIIPLAATASEAASGGPSSSRPAATPRPQAPVAAAAPASVAATAPGAHPIGMEEAFSEDDIPF